MQTDYQRGMVDAASRIWNSAACLNDHSEYRRMCDKINEIIAENTPKKSEAEKFVEKYRGKFVLWRGKPERVAYREGECIALGEECQIKKFVHISEITYTLEPVPYTGE